jgi:crossover junction endodeoxyribonuclease RusA
MAKTRMLYVFDIPLKPKAKGRPRAGRHGMYTDKATREYEELIAKTYRDLNGPKFEGNIMLTVTFQTTHIHVSILGVKEESKLRGDVDNYVKSLLDGLNGVAFDDDKQVVSLRAYKR